MTVIVSHYLTDNHPGYYLVDGIYPPYSIFVSSFVQPADNRQRLFSKRQEAVRKDVERAFGALKGRWHILQRPAMLWDADALRRICLTCVILHNMLVEAGDEGNVKEFQDEFEMVIRDERAEVVYHPEAILRDSLAHFELRDDLVAHIWQQYGEE